MELLLLELREGEDHARIHNTNRNMGIRIHNDWSRSLVSS